MNKKIVGVVGLASVALVGGTFAYFTQSTTIDNPFDTANYQTVVTEDFVPEDGEDWQPGAEVNKDLYVQNTGDRDVVVRVKLEDYWYRGDSLITKDQKDGTNTFVELVGEPVIKHPAATENGTETFQLDPDDGEAEGDGTVVFKTFENTDKWVFNEEDGYFYYKTTLPAGASTEKVLDKVQLDPQLDLGLFNTMIYSKVDEKGKNPEVKVPEDVTDIDKFMVENGWTWIRQEDGKDVSVIPTSIDLFNKMARTDYTKESLLANNQGIYTTAVTRAESDKLGYSDAKYVLRIKVETVQATDKAVQATFEKVGAVMGELNWNLSAENLEDQPVTMLP